METSNNILQTVKALLMPSVLVLVACYGFYQSHENTVARAAKRTLDNLPANSVESREWFNWSVRQAGYADPEKFLLYWNAQKNK